MIQPNTHKRDRSKSQAFDLSKLFDQAPPAAVEHEMCLLGSMLLDDRVIGQVVDVLGHDGNAVMYKPAHATIYDVILAMYDAQEPIELVNINQRLRDKGQLEYVGGTAYLVELGQQVPSPASAPYYAQQVKNAALKRQLIESASETLHDAYRSPDDAAEQIERAQSRVMALADRQAGKGSVNDMEGLQAVYDELDRLNHKGMTGLATGLRTIDDMTKGLQPGDMVILAGRPSMGKSAMGMTIAKHVAITLRKQVLFFSLEMDYNSLTKRLLSMDSCVPFESIRGNTLSTNQFDDLSRSIGRMHDAPLKIDDTPGLSMTQIMARARNHHLREPISLIVIDYLQLIEEPGRYSNRQEQVSTISRKVKALARQIRCPVLCLAQLNRGPESRENHRPRMSDLRESGSIEQDADVIMLMHREEYYHDEQWLQDNPDKRGMAEAIIAKQRNGPTGTCELVFRNETVSFDELAY